MKKNRKKGAIRIAIGLIGAGALIFTAAFAASGFNLKELALGASSYTRADYSPEGSFESVEIQDDVAHIRILPSEDGACSVQCDEERPGSCAVTVEDNVLRVRRQRKWYDAIGVRLARPEVTVRLPEARYRAIEARTASGSIEAEGLEAGKLALRSSSGSVELRDVRADALEAKSTSGSVRIERCAIAGEAALRSTSGSVSVENLEAEALRAESTSGGVRILGAAVESLSASSTSGAVKLTETTARGKVELHTTSGGIQLERADGAEFEIRSTSGSIKGSVRSDKRFEVKSTSGSVEVPPSVQDAGIFRAATTSGSVRITVE